jgi:hypothetical protein
VETVTVFKTRRIKALTGAVAMTALATALIGCKTKSTSDQVTAHLTSTSDNLRTGWYPTQPGLDPVVVGGPSFGRVWQTALPLTPGEQVFAQPLVKSTTVFVATEGNNLYALDAQTGAIKASRALGTPFRATDIGCGDLNPSIGITGTPVIDDATNTAYFFSKTYLGDSNISDPSNVGWFAHAVDVDTLVERAGFPVSITGTASNDTTVAFNPFSQHQRTALLLMNGVVYAGFGSHCDIGTWRGWVAGVGTDGKLKTLFATMVGNDTGGGLWGSGGGLVSDADGRIFFTTGNGSGVDVTPRARPNWQLSESAVRLQVQSDGSLLPTDFFAPSNRVMLDQNDEDFGAGGPVGLPSQYFGTPTNPNLMIAAGKAPTIYVLDRDQLGGFAQGGGGGDAVVSTATAKAGLWSRVAVWPGDGGYIYAVTNGPGIQAFKYGLSSAGVPTFSPAGLSVAGFGYTSGSPIVTSDGTNSGTAVVWAINSTGAFGTGTLQGYAAVPDATGKLALLYEDTYGATAKFSVPGVGGGRLYVGSGDGHVLAYGSPVSTAVTVPALVFGPVVAGSSQVLNVTVTATQAVTVNSIASSSALFNVGTPSATLPVSLAAGATLLVPVTFAPTASGLFAASLNVTTSGGVVAGSLRGTGQAATAALQVTPAVADFGGVARGTTNVLNVTLTNVGAQTLTWSGFTQPAAPFSASGLPAVGQTIAAGSSVTVALTFAPTANGSFGGSFGIQSSGGNATVMTSGSAGDPPALSITPMTLNFTGPVGQIQTMGFTVMNTGGSPLTITKSKPPSLGVFATQTALDEGTVIPAGQSRLEKIAFMPPTTGTFSDQWTITGNDTSGVQTVAFTGTGLPGVCSASDLTACTGATPVCDLATNTCVACVGNAQCGGNTPVCNLGPHTCRGCASDSDCGGAAPACESNGACGVCSATNATACIGGTPVCNPASSTCVACLGNAQCSGTAPICNLATHTCRACASDGDCTGATPACQAGGSCGACSATNATKCTGATPVCNQAAATCVACLGNAQCSGSAPICNLPTHACRACAGDGDCGGATPACQPGGACGVCSPSNHGKCTGTTPICNPAAGACVGCNSSADCSGATPICNAATHACRGCAGDGECGGTTPACQPGGACAACSASNRTRCVGSAPICNTAAGACVACLANADCGGSTPFCEGTTHACRACATDGECPAATPACQPSGACGACSAGNSSRCTGTSPVCNVAAGSCVGCLTGAQCSGATPACDPGTHVCRACSGDRDCGGTTPACQPKGSCGVCSASNTSRCTGSTSNCDVTTGICDTCVTDAQCAAAAPVCDTTSHKCRACAGDADCGGSAPACQPGGACGACSAANVTLCTGSTPMCLVATGTCVACLVSAQCGGTAPTCDANTHTCRGCAGDGECGGATPACQPRGACGACSVGNAAACTGSTALCDVSSGVCVGCLTATDCAISEPVCDGTSHTCRTCVTDGECPGAQADAGADGGPDAAVDAPDRPPVQDGGAPDANGDLTAADGARDGAGQARQNGGGCGCDFGGERDDGALGLWLLAALTALRSRRRGATVGALPLRICSK